MTTITIPKNLITEKDLMIIPRSQYENFLKYITSNEEYEDLWKNTAKNKFLKSYNKSDSIYDKI